MSKVKYKDKILKALRHHSTKPPKLYIIILYCWINHASIMAYNCNCFCLFIVKTDKRILLL